MHLGPRLEESANLEDVMRARAAAAGYRMIRDGVWHVLFAVRGDGEEQRYAPVARLASLAAVGHWLETQTTRTKET